MSVISGQLQQVRTGERCCRRTVRIFRREARKALNRSKGKWILLACSPRSWGLWGIDGNSRFYSLMMFDGLPTNFYHNSGKSSAINPIKMGFNPKITGTLWGFKQLNIDRVWMIMRDSPNAINQPFGDRLYHPFMVRGWLRFA